MAGETFDIVFSGRIAQGADPAQVKANVANLFKTTPAKVEHLFSGQRVFIKKGVDEAAARNYQAALSKAGALVEVVSRAAASEPVVAATARRPPDAASPPAPPSASSAAASPPEPAGPPVAPDYTVAEPGVLLVEAPSVPPARIDTAHLSLAEVGADLADRGTAPAPNYDLSGLTLDPPGTLLVAARPVPPAQFDTSALSLAE